MWALLRADAFIAILARDVRGDRANAGDVVTGRIFISYRRSDDQSAAGRLYDRLLQHFDREQLFMDVDAIEPGVDFVKSLDEQVANCIAFIAVIRPQRADCGWPGRSRPAPAAARYARDDEVS